MTNVVTEPLSVSYLQWLCGPLAHNLPLAVRLWVWIRLLYGVDSSLDLPSRFSLADCRNALFLDSHPRGESKPAWHDVDCACCKSVAAWLFLPSLQYSQADYEAMDEVPVQQARIAEQIQTFENELKAQNILPKKFHDFLKGRLFGVTRRTLANDLETLVAKGWLTAEGNGVYKRVDILPELPAAMRSGLSEVDFLLQPDLAVMASNLAKTVHGKRRFLVHVDYVVPSDRHDQVEDWQDLLGQLWQANDSPVVALSYWSPALLTMCRVVVHPVCIYYYRRGPYLCGFGQVPGQDARLVDWRNYRLDRIQSITPLAWTDEVIPERLQICYQTRALPEPDEIELRMSQVWGFDYYQPSQTLLIRFDAHWDRRYIQNSLRHPTFQPVSFQQVQRLIAAALTEEKQQTLRQLLATRSCEDAYYRAIYRHHDPNVHQRLRAWRPHVEVLLPLDLRQQMAAEARRELSFYEVGEEAFAPKGFGDGGLVTGMDAEGARHEKKAGSMNGE